MLRLLIVFFLGMFWKLVFCKLENMRWPSNNLKYLTEVLGQMAKATLHLWHTLTQMLQKKALFLSKIPTPKNGIQYK